MSPPCSANCSAPRWRTEAVSDATDTPAGHGPQAYALVSAQGQTMGVLAGALVQVVQRPARLAQMPRAGQNLAGLLDFRGQAVPVVDLAQWSGSGAPDTAPQYIAVLHEHRQLIGLLIDAVQGLKRFAPTQVQRLHHDDAPAEFFHSVARQDGEDLLPLLDAGRLMRQAQAWASGTADRDALSPAPQAGAPASTRSDLGESYAVLRIGGRRCGLRAADLAEVLPRPPLQAVWGNGTELLGMLRWRGRDVPLVNPHAALGGAPPESDAPWVAILCDERHCVALPCDGMDQVRRFERASVMPAEGADLPGRVCDGLVLDDDPSHNIHLLNSAALLGAFAVRSISATRPTTAGAGVGQRNSVAQVVFQARGRYAAPINQLQEILPVAPGMAPQITADGRAGSLNWRGQALPLFDLERCLWPRQVRSAAAPKRILISRVGGQLSALLVGEVDMLIPPLAGVQTRMRLPSGEPVELITVGQGDEQASYGLLDLGCLQLPGATTSPQP
jgi:purine-binding chemotaxis protein CheW